MLRHVTRNEKEVAEKVLENGFTNELFNYQEALAVAKHFRHVLGYGDRRVKRYLIDFISERDPSYNVIVNHKPIKSIVTKSKNHFSVSGVFSITQSEIDALQKVESFRFQKILLGLLVIAKISGKDYVPTNRWADVKQIAKKNASTLDVRECVHYAYLHGLIGEPSRKGTFHKLLFLNNESEPVFLIENEKDLSNLVKNYEIFIGGEFRYCTICGKKFKKTKKKQNLCSEHIREKELERKRKWWNKSTRRA